MEDKDTVPIDHEAGDFSPGDKVGFLQIIRGDDAGREFELKPGNNFVGRQKDCDIQLRHGSISRSHAQLVCNPNEPIELRYCIYDLQSTNGVRVNGEPRASSVLRVGDRVQFGSVVCKFMLVGDIERGYMEQIKKLMEDGDRTNLLQIKPFYERLEETLGMTDAGHDALAVLMMDLDGLEKINEEHGHLIGAEIIVMIADLMSEEFSPSGVAAIYGGDEFAAYIESSTKSEAVERAEHLRALVSELRLADKGVSERVTISIGVATYPLDGVEMTQLVGNADKALLKAKSEGKNRVVAYEPDMPEAP